MTLLSALVSWLLYEWQSSDQVAGRLIQAASLARRLGVPHDEVVEIMTKLRDFYEENRSDFAKGFMG
jgi:hypothetical protein